MIAIDGSYEEGGGQILRTATALSVLTNKAITITNIRAKRPNPGLRAQHLTTIKILETISDAETEGLEIGSKKIRFCPNKIRGGTYTFDVGTAGSITLIFQAIMLASFNLSETLNLKIKGGTDVRWSPSWDYFAKVFVPIVSNIGVKTDLELKRRGFYPAGGGEAHVTIYPSSNYVPLIINEQQEYDKVDGNIVISKLPDHISTRIKHSIVKFFLSNSIDAKLSVERDDSSLSEGVAVTLWSNSGKTIIGSAMLGEKGLPSEKLGGKCATTLLQEMSSGASLDVHATDQLLAYLAFVAVENNDISIFLTREISSHAQTTMWLIEKFLPVVFEVKKIENLFEVTVKPS
ncbi:MAG TPA: RNA 3'-terminal phosphate cyclase [Thermoplasmatales archaeon]|nr:RNA 3'-terminal phosphate cyclase [Thermoplasmatales archaeon]